MNRWLMSIIVTVVLWAVIGLLYGIYLWNTRHFHLGYWLQYHTGTINEPGPYYGFFSGFGSDLGEITLATGIFASLTHAYRVRNCEVHGCWRIGRHKTAANHKVCRVHHPDEHLTAQDIVDAHNDAKSGDDCGGPGSGTGSDSSADRS